MIGTATKTPDAPDASKNYGSKAGFAKDSYRRAGTKLTWDINKNFKLTSDFRFTDFDREYILLRRVIYKDTAYSVRVDYQGKNKNTNPQGDIMLKYQLKTGKVKQDISIGCVADFLRTQIPATKATKSYSVPSHRYDLETEYPVIPLFDTIVNSGAPFFTSIETFSKSAIFLDHISIGEKLDIFAGLTYASITDKSWNSTTGLALPVYDKSALTPSAAIIFTPVRFLSVYSSFIQALQKGPTAPIDNYCVNSGAIMNPYISNQYEVGTKISAGRMHFQVAAFYIEQANSYNDSTIGGGRYTFTLDGREIHKGFEITSQGRIIKSLSMNMGFTLLDAKITKTSTQSLIDKEPIGVTKIMGKMNLEYSLPFIKGLHIYGTTNYTGEQWIDVANTLTVNPVTTFDAGIRYEKSIGHNVITIRSIVNNLTNENYWTTRSSILYLGDPRSVIFSLSYTW